MEEFIQKYWTLIAAGITVVLAFARLEFRSRLALTKVYSEETARIESIKEAERRWKDTRNEDREQARRDYVDIKGLLGEVRTDIKELLQKRD
jgi:hypothetical protein